MNKQYIIISGGVIIILAILTAFLLLNSNKQKKPQVSDISKSTEEIKQKKAQEPVNTPKITIDKKMVEKSLKEKEHVTRNDNKIKTFEVEASNFRFSPNIIKVSKGDKVRIAYRVKQGYHDLVIDELEVNTPQVNAGEGTMVEFTATKKGTFEFYCSIGNHRKRGMVGKLIVK